MTLQQQRLASLSADLVKAEAELSKSEARLSAARELATNGGADTLPEVQQSRIIQDLIAQRVRVERQVSEAQAMLLPAHPRMRQLNADLAGVQRALRSEIRTIINSISKEVRLSELRTRQLRTEIGALKKTAVNRSGDEAKLRALEATAQSKRSELERLQKQLEDNRTVVDTNRVPVESTIISTARPSGTPVFPKKLPYTLLAMAATLMLGLSLSIARGLMATGGPVEHNRRASDQLSANADLPGSRRSRRGDRGDAQKDARQSEFVDKVTAAKANLEQRANRAADAEQAAGSEPGRTGSGRFDAKTIVQLAERCVELTPDGGGFRLIIAGSTETVDPSNEAIELVTELSEAGGTVLMIDWTLAGQPLLKEIDVGNAASLAELISGKAEFDDILVPLPDTHVHYVFSADVPDQRQLLDEANLNLILDALDEAYDHVVIFGRHDDACALFEAIQGRFDAGITISEPSVGRPLPSKDTFLDFAVANIEIMDFVRVGPIMPAANPKKAPLVRRTNRQNV